MISEELHNVIAWYYRITRGPESLSFAFFYKRNQNLFTPGYFCLYFPRLLYFPAADDVTALSTAMFSKIQTLPKALRTYGFCARIKVNALRSYQPQNFDQTSDSKSGPSLVEIFSAPELINIVLVRS